MIKFWQKKNLASFLLLPFSLAYWFFAIVDSIFSREERFDKKIICVGNVVAGGAGKTPVSIALAKLLISKGRKVCFAVRNYKSNSGGKFHITSNSKYNSAVVEEAFEMCKIADVYIAQTRLGSIRYAAKNSKADIIIVDDGLQNYRFYKDKAILVVDGLQKFGNNFIIPSGPLREFISSAIKKVDAIVVVNSEDKNFLRCLKKYGKPLITAHSDSKVDLESRLFAFCGIGFPEKFYEPLKHLGAELVGTKNYPDHYQYTNNDIEYLKKVAKDKNAKLVTTRKDAIKIHDKKDILVVEYELKIENDDNLLKVLNEKN
ncbi:MAG: tetraacyldisaccharide 4'-kinase [Rickettsiales bacterium]